MVERVARVIDGMIPRVPTMNYGPAFEFHDGSIVLLNSVEIARTAIEAMREPTEEMLTAGLAPDWQVIEEWQAMIDAALEGGGGALWTLPTTPR